MKKNRKAMMICILVLVLGVNLSGCAAIKSKIQTMKGDLIGASYNIEFYDNYGAGFLNVTGEKISLSGNCIDSSYDEAGELSSVITLTIDGHNMETTGSTVIFADEHLKKLEDFSVEEIQSQSGDSLFALTSISRNLNALKNLAGVSKVVLIQSQMGVPICAYTGDEVYWEIANDLPKTTKLMIDGYPLYIHRANYQIIDTELLK